MDKIKNPIINTICIFYSAIVFLPVLMVLIAPLIILGYIDLRLNKNDKNN